MDVTTLKQTAAGRYKFVKPIQETQTYPVTGPDGNVSGHKTRKIGDAVKTMEVEGETVNVGDTFEPSMYWCGRNSRLLDPDDGFVEKVGDGAAAVKLAALEALKVAASTGDFDGLKDPLAVLDLKRPKSKDDAFEFAATIIRLTQVG